MGSLAISDDAFTRPARINPLARAVAIFPAPRKPTLSSEPMRGFVAGRLLRKKVKVHHTCLSAARSLRCQRTKRWSASGALRPVGQFAFASPERLDSCFQLSP